MQRNLLETLKTRQMRPSPCPTLYILWQQFMRQWFQVSKALTKYKYVNTCTHAHQTLWSKEKRSFDLFLTVSKTASLYLPLSERAGKKPGELKKQYTCILVVGFLYCLVVVFFRPLSHFIVFMYVHNVPPADSSAGLGVYVVLFCVISLLFLVWGFSFHRLVWNHILNQRLYRLAWCGKHNAIGWHYGCP